MPGLVKRDLFTPASIALWIQLTFAKAVGCADRRCLGIGCGDLPLIFCNTWLNTSVSAASNLSRSIAFDSLCDHQPLWRGGATAAGQPTKGKRYPIEPHCCRVVVPVRTLNMGLTTPRGAGIVQVAPGNELVLVSIGV